MLNAAEVALRRVAEQVRAPAPARRPRPGRLSAGRGEPGVPDPGVPRDRANSRSPFTELWLSAVSTSREVGPNGYASPTRRHAPVAFGVKMTAYSSRAALKYRRTASLACSISSVEASDVGLSECGLPKHPPRSRSVCARSWASAASPEPV